jgi:hypothetical protein
VEGSTGIGTGQKPFVGKANIARAVFSRTGSWLLAADASIHASPCETMMVVTALDDDGGHHG